jgi:catechol 2,3-dioxygenase-like lactoylglutathione lyase family enzyme
VTISLDHVLVAAPVGCEQDARRFFGGLLGLDEIAKPEPLRSRGGVWFELGGHQLHIGIDETFSPALKAHLAFRVGCEAIDELAARLGEAGSTVEWDASIPGVRRFYTADPWGNRMEFLAGALPADPRS